ncbi:hypothetical protein IW261DRAFT_1443942 [Armillaria novae-zelandiae]|uniref:Uncharacterized protein n=1 Tax=Armillaria novae-zelandiae TaxID=153914 RepID=A0AA39UIQ4_9AGAR|nr:hypothetical protein IW261DRAFT_1443942 [Armillaria novae-zelandiae]
MHISVFDSSLGSRISGLRRSKHSASASLVSGASAVGLNLPKLAHEMRITFHSAHRRFLSLCIHTVTRDIASTFCRAGRSVFTARHRFIPLIHRLWLHAAEYGVLTRKIICHTECAQSGRTEERRRSRRCGDGKLKPGSAEMQQEVYSVSPTLIHVLPAEFMCSMPRLALQLTAYRRDLEARVRRRMIRLSGIISILIDISVI